MSERADRERDREAAVPGGGTAARVHERAKPAADVGREVDLRPSHNRESKVGRRYPPTGVETNLGNQLVPVLPRPAAHTNRLARDRTGSAAEHRLDVTALDGSGCAGESLCPGRVVRRRPSQAGGQELEGGPPPSAATSSTAQQASCLRTKIRPIRSLISELVARTNRFSQSRNR
jgi:hypothetical protein